MGGGDGSGGGRNPFLEDLVEFDNEGNPIAVAVPVDVVDSPTLAGHSPLHHSSHCFPQ